MKLEHGSAPAPRTCRYLSLLLLISLIPPFRRQLVLRVEERFPAKVVSIIIIVIVVIVVVVIAIAIITILHATPPYLTTCSGHAWIRFWKWRNSLVTCRS